jgi:flagellum-specific ATP synthase
VRSILDGHIVLSREIAERGRFPAVDVMASISRMLPGCNTSEQNHILSEAKKHISTYLDIIDLVRIGAYKRGADPKTDRSLDLYHKIEDFLKQAPNEQSCFDDGYAQLESILKQPNDEL